MPRNTRKRQTRRQRGGFFSPDDKVRIQTAATAFAQERRDQIQHCMSQLKRFAPCIQGKPIRAHQFFYNLGRLQELLGETTHPEIWWKPIESLVEGGKYDQLAAHADALQELIGIPYDQKTLDKGC